MACGVLRSGATSWVRAGWWMLLVSELMAGWLMSTSLMSGLLVFWLMSGLTVAVGKPKAQGRRIISRMIAFIVLVRLQQLVL